MPITLRNYQLKGIEWLKEKQRCMLLDEPGLGKSQQAIRAATLPVLVACPGYLIEQWQKEIRLAYPEHSVAMCVGDHDKRQNAIDCKCQWTIINIEMLRTFSFPQHFYATFIIDEAHHVRGHSAKQSKNARTLAKRIPNVFLLTATPIKHEVDDLFMELSIVAPDIFSSYYAFVGDFCKTIDTGWGTKVVGPNNPDALRSVLSRYALRRTYQSTDMQRNSQIDIPVSISPSASWYKTYTKLKDNYRISLEGHEATFETAGAMMRGLRTLTFDLKSVAAQQIYEDNPDTIFYVYYRSSAQALGKLLDIPAIDGSMPPKERAQIAKSGGSVVGTISSISEGIDLTHLSTICFLETSYSPDDLVQATARLIRWNKNIRPVRVFEVTVAKTIDTTIKKTITRRDADEKSILQEELSTE